MAMKGNKYGIHRVIEPQGVLTQAAYKIDNDMTKLYSNEIMCDVISLNIDSASFTQISEACGGDEKKIGWRQDRFPGLPVHDSAAHRQDQGHP